MALSGELHRPERAANGRKRKRSNICGRHDASFAVADIACCAERGQKFCMTEESIAEVGIDDEARLYVRPATASFDYIYRAAMEVNWDASTRRLFSPKPREWTYLDWFKQIIAAAADEYGTALRLTSDTGWTKIPASLRAEIEGFAAS